MTKTFTYAGVSTLNGVCKFRVANDATRVKVLAFNGHKDIDIIELKEPLTKEDAVAFLLSINFDNGNAVVRATMEAELEKATPVVKAPRAPKAEKAAKVPKVPTADKAPKTPTTPLAPKSKAKVGPTIAAIQARAAAKVAADAEKATVKVAVDDADNAPY